MGLRDIDGSSYQAPGKKVHEPVDITTVETIDTTGTDGTNPIGPRVEVPPLITETPDTSGAGVSQQFDPLAGLATPPAPVPDAEAAAGDGGDDGASGDDAGGGDDGGSQEPEPGNYDDLLKDDLVALANERGVDSSGTKAEIIERLVAQDAENAAADQPSA